MVNEQGEPGPGLEDLRRALIERQREVDSRPEDAAAHVRLAEACEELARLRQRAAAASSAPGAGGSIHLVVEIIGLRRRAAAAWTEAARLSPQEPAHHSGRARALGRLSASLTSSGEDAGEALTLMAEAADAYANAFRLAPGDADAHTRRGALLSAIGVSRQREGDHEGALARYQEALVDLRTAQRLAPESPVALSEAGWALVRLGGVEAALGRPADAIASLEAAIATFADLRRVAPRNSFGSLSQGQAYTALGDVQAGTRARPGPPVTGRASPVDRGISAYRQAITCFDAALQIVPGDPVTSLVKAEALQGLGELQVLASRGPEALTAYREALSIYDGPLAGHAQSFQYQIGRGRSLLREAELSADLGDREAFTPLLEAARAELSRDVPVDAMAGAARARLLERVQQHLGGGGVGEGGGGGDGSGGGDGGGDGGGGGVGGGGRGEGPSRPN